MGKLTDCFNGICKRRTPFVERELGGLQYREYKPVGAAGEKRPLVLFLHGAGERGNDNFRQLKHAITKVVYPKSISPFMDAVVLAPQCPAGAYWTNADHKNGAYRVKTTEETELCKQLVALVREYVKEGDIDENRVYVVGLSMGGYATWELLARYPDLFAAGVPVCGGGPLDKADVLKDIPVFAFHGRRDPVVPYKGTADTVNAILAAGGASVLFKTYENGYHGIWNKAITFKGDERLPALAEWLFSQAKTVRGQGI